MFFRNALCAALLLLASPFVPRLCYASDASPFPITSANDNRTPAGNLTNGILTLRLALREARWYAEEPDGVYEDVYSFAEEGHAPQSPGPLIRVTQGTRIHITLHNVLPVAAKIYGLHSHPGDSVQAFQLQAGETRELQFDSGEPGTYMYSGDYVQCTPRASRRTFGRRSAAGWGVYR